MGTFGEQELSVGIANISKNIDCSNQSNAEEFAKLIINECIRACNQNRDPAISAAQCIERHFGIK